MSESPVAVASPVPEGPATTPRGDARVVFRPAGHILQILARSPAGELETRLRALSDGAPFAVRAAGPGAWFLVGEAALTPAALAEVERALGRDAAWIDQTHGRVRLEIAGFGAARRLATGTALDLSLRRCPVGFAAETLFGAIGVHIARTGAQTFELLVGRSFAASLWEDLTG